MNTKLKVLIACETSQIVAEQFHLLGHDVLSCDIEHEGEKGLPHYKGNVLDIINDGFDLMIGHPPCDFLSYAGIRWFNVENYGESAIERHKKKEEAMKFFFTLLDAGIPHIAIENPRGFPMMKRKPSQRIHPYFFGDPQKKLTLLWLKNLPKLVHIKQDDLFSIRTHTDEPQPIYIDKVTGEKRYKTDSIAGNSKNGKKERSRFFTGVARAMAEQWTEYILNKKQS